MGKVKEQFDDVLSAVNNANEFVNMWVGPRDATEIAKTLEGNPTLVPCAIGPNLNDGDGVHGFKKRKNFMTIEEMHRWIKDQKPDQQKFPCPYCSEENTFIGNSANELATHMEEDHKPATVVSTLDMDSVEAAKQERVSKKKRGRPPEHKDSFK
jgi:hypothetical protein